METETAYSSYYRTSVKNIYILIGESYRVNRSKKTMKCTIK